jgi:hypothetical protein
MAGERKVAFTEDAARRVAAATVAYERGSRDMPPIKFRQASGDGDPIRLCRTSAAWAKGTSATLNVWEEGTPPGETQSTGQTVDAVNKIGDVADGAFVHVALAQNGTWYLIEAEDQVTEGCHAPSIGGRDLSQIPDYDAAKTQALIHEAGCLKWLDIEDCPTGGD